LHGLRLLFAPANQKFMKVSICSAYHSAASREFLQINYAVTKKLNPKQEFTWIVADNTAADYPANDKIDADKFLVVKGINLTNVHLLPTWPPGREITEHNAAGWKHGGGLNSAAEHVQTRFAVFLDNNCYIVRPNWISDVIEHMKKHALAFFGPPPDPLRTIHYKYFPNPHHAFFVDTAKVPVSELDFGPNFEYKRKTKKISNALNWLPKNKLFKKLVFNPLRVNTGGDAGRQIYEKYYKNKKIDFEIALPVIKINPIDKFIFSFYPERFSIIPKNKNSYTSFGFKETGYFDAKGAGLEEYMWQNKPFAIHIRGKGDQWKFDQVPRIRAILDNLT
jgi:hypothetical protein